MLTRIIIVAVAWAVLTAGLGTGIWPLSLWPLSMVMVAIAVFCWEGDEVVREEGPLSVPLRQERSALEKVAVMLLIGDVLGRDDEA